MIKTFISKYNIKAIIFVVTAALMTSLGQMFWKLSKNTLAFLFIGFMLYGAGSLLFIIALKNAELSVVQPMMSVGYIFALVIGIIILNENVTYGQILAVFFIIIGVSFIGGKDV
ncbi:MAG: EamA family transporter [Bacillota bacterium]|nr:EamA family transporter [Bacillota bacterium]